ncbi:MAG TPA: site-specific DNA-methyltransferase [Methanoculleus sp.]|nr:site-specific DNA-methyltransferase [Methanoculleus sp.]
MTGRRGPFSLDEVYLGDSLELMPGVPSESVDLIVTDPPFAIDFRARKGNYNRAGDRVLNGYCEIDRDDYLAFTTQWMAEAFRILTTSGSVYVFSGWSNLKDILIGLDAAGFTTVNHLIWKYQFGVFTKKKYVTSHYHILFAVRNPKRYTFNKIDHYPEDVWEINREYWKGKVKTPTKLPLQLVQKILRYSSNEGDLVFDPFLGSGTVAVASATLNRRYLGFEIVEDYLRFARARLARITDSPPPV